MRVEEGTLHDLRTSLRRLEAALRLLKTILGKGRSKEGMDRIEYLRELTGPLRERDVERRVLAGMGLVGKMGVLAERQGKERAFQRVLGDPAFAGLFLDLERLFKEDPPGLKRKVRASFRKEWGRLEKTLKAYREKGPRPKVLHRLRIRSKRLRYGLEMFPFLRPGHRKRILKAASEVQDRLGEWRDLQEALKGRGGRPGELLRAREAAARRGSLVAIRRLDGLMERSGPGG
jgi:CHAD domain-containing protein